MSNLQEWGRVVTLYWLLFGITDLFLHLGELVFVTWQQGLLTHPVVTLNIGPLSERVKMDLKHVFTNFYGKTTLNYTSSVGKFC